VTALGRVRDEALAVPEQHRLSEARARRDDRHVAGAFPGQRRSIQRAELGTRRLDRTERQGDQVVEQPDALDLGLARDNVFVDDPGQVGRDAAPVDDGAGDGERGALDGGLWRDRAEELQQRRLEGRNLLAREFLLAHRASRGSNQGEPGVRATDVADEIHAARQTITAPG